MTRKLGRLTQLDLRNAWKHEANDLTRWMVDPENIALLCDELDIEVENVQRESAVGRFNVDILATEADSGRTVIIENQLEVTDHKHLGQLLTYAAGHDASIIIWVVADFRDEHKQAIEWFNRHMPKEISFFLVQLELWTIGNSDPAPRFNVVARPNYWGKVVREAGKGDRESESRLQQQAYWEGLKEYGARMGTNVGLSHMPRPQHWYNISIGTSRAHIGLTMNRPRKFVACELNIHADDGLYEQLAADAPAINEALGGLNLDWREMPERTSSRIIAIHNCDPTDQKQWPEQFDWLIRSAERFKEVFQTRVR